MQRRSRFEPLAHFERRRSPPRRSPPRRSPPMVRRSPPLQRRSPPLRMEPPFSRGSPPPSRRSPPPPHREYDRFDRRLPEKMLPRMQHVAHEPEFREPRPRLPSNYDHPPVEKNDNLLYFSDCVMYPPNRTDKPVVPRTKKPNGCKTIYIGGIPDVVGRIPKRLNSILSEVFIANGGDIDGIRISGRGFCHIRFQREESVGKALSLSGYYMEVKQGYEPDVKFRIMLDYATSQTDEEDYESKKLIANRLNMQGTDIPDIPAFSSFGLEKLSTDLKNPDSYFDAIVVLRYWMSGNLNKQTSVRFFNMLQTSSVQIKRLQVEKKQLNDEYDIMMERYNKNLGRLDKEFDHLMSLFEDARKQKLWDHFTKPQRKSIDTWLETVRESISINEKGVQRGKTAQEVAKNVVAIAPTPAVKKEGIVNNVDSDDQTTKINTLQESLDAMQKQVWEMVSKLHNKELELQKKQEQLDSLNGGGIEPQGALSTYLLAYPKGATMEAMENYLGKEFKITINRGKLESQLLQMCDVFSKQITVENDKTTMKWKCVLMDGE